MSDLGTEEVCPLPVDSPPPLLLTVVKEIGDCIIKGILMIAVMIGLLFVSFLTTIAWAAKDNCTTELNTCTTELNNAQTNLGTCTTGLGSCNTNLGSCNTNFTNAQTTAATCQTNLATCQANVAECSQEAPPTSWDQQLACDSTSNCPRFEVLSAFDNAAVLDKETGLVWEQTPNNAHTDIYNVAAIECVVAQKGNRMGWRLPTVAELTSLITPAAVGGGGALPPGSPFANLMGWYWTTTPVLDAAGDYYIVDPTSPGGLVGEGAATNGNYTWCVRGGAGP